MKRIQFMLAAMLVSIMAIAQEGGADLKVDVTESTSSAGSFPWMWVIIGAIVLILLIVILSSGSRGTDRVVERKTVIKD